MRGEGRVQQAGKADERAACPLFQRPEAEAVLGDVGIQPVQ
jgi:hypothetical protein